jgi:DNA-binding NarL/FixJ family response regulator
MPTLSAFIVEDNPTILSNLVATLEELTSVRIVGSAPSEEAAVRGLHEHATDLDLVLEAAQGMQMRARRVVRSNFATPEVRRRCLALGAAEVFDKSRDLDALIDYCDKLAEV